MGRPPLKEPFVNLNMKVPPEVRKMIEDYATQHGVALVDVVSRAVEAYTARERKVVVPWPRIVVRGGEDMQTVIARRIREALDRGLFSGNQATEAAMAGLRALNAGLDLEKRHHAVMLASTRKMAEDLDAPGLKVGISFPKDAALRLPSKLFVSGTEKDLLGYAALMGWADEAEEKR